MGFAGVGIRVWGCRGVAVSGLRLGLRGTITHRVTSTYIVVCRVSVSFTMGSMPHNNTWDPLGFKGLRDWVWGFRGLGFRGTLRV